MHIGLKYVCSFTAHIITSFFVVVFILGKCAGEIQSAPCCTSVWTIRNTSGILSTASQNLSPHTKPVLERLWLQNLQQLWERVNLTSVGLNIEFSWLKAVLTNESEAQCTLCQRTLNFDALGVKALVSHTKSEKHQLASKSLQQSHTITHFCTPPSPVPGCPVLLDLNSAPPLLSHSQVTFKPS